MIYDYLIVGAGFAGITLAERIASQLNKKVFLIDCRNHIGGNTFDYYNNDGILVQKYGPHIFHTKLQYVWDYLCQFTQWNDYVHKVLVKTHDKEVYLPINIDTMETLYDRKFTPDQLKQYFEKVRVNLSDIKNSRDVVVSQVGEELYELFFKNYTKKQWGVYPDELDAQVTQRLPVRFNRDVRYFEDAFQGIPKHGYAEMFENMIRHKNIHVCLNAQYKDIVNAIKFRKLIYTGPIDEYFDYVHGKLPYRSLDFKWETLNMEKYQNAAVVNYPNEGEFTRITEFKYFYGQSHSKTTICFEYPKAEGAPYYPIPMRDNQEMYIKYKRDSKKMKSVYFVGRLAEYKYFNMDQVVARALETFEELI